MDYFYWLVFSIPIVVISATVHEFAHAWVATKLGDTTPQEEGRLTLNPIAHIDPVGFLFMIFARIGWAKPVPVNINNFENPMRGQFLTAIAGPLSNILFAFLVAGLFKITLLISGFLSFILIDFLSQIFMVFIYINVALAFFNLIPIPPLDGGNIVETLLPDDWREGWHSLGNILPFALLLFVVPGFPFFAIFSQFWYNFIENAVSLVLRVFSI